jgi:glycerol-3-phosphate dehydrogenase
MKTDYDVIIMGAGVVGSMIARFLSRYRLKILLLEKEADVGMGASSANSAIVHAGYDPVPGSLKAITNVAGNAMWDALAGELGIPFDRRGDYVVAVGQEELPGLEVLLERGRRNGVPGMHLISGDEMMRREPNINPQVSGALWAPTGGICDPFQATIAAAENAVQNGAEFLLETAFHDFMMDGKRIVGVKTNRGVLNCRWVVNAAGLYSDEVMHKAGVRVDFKITPRRGEYSILDRADITINNVLFPVPSEAGKGTLVTATLHGNTLVGPNAQYVEEKEDRAISKPGQDEIWQGAHKLFPGLEARHIIAVYAGLRSSGNARSLGAETDLVGDFVIEIPTAVKGLVNLGGIESPGLTAAPAIAQMVVDLMQEAGEKLVEKDDWHPIRPARPVFRHLPHDERARLVKNDPSYGRVICRCELVTEGEILAEIRASIPARTYDAIKRRTWLGTGRCQGAFDMPRMVELLAQELGISPFEVSKKGSGSEFLYRRTKEAVDTEAQDAA